MTVLERTNARELRVAAVRAELVVCDVSFISLRTACRRLLRARARPAGGVALVKPQFEAGRADSPKGVVRNRRCTRVLRKVPQGRGMGAGVVGVVDSGLPGPKGNREFFLHLVQTGRQLPADLDRWIDDAVG